MKAKIDYAARLAVLLSQVDGDSIAIENGFEIPREPARYLAVEMSDEYPVWAMNAATLQELAAEIDASETARTSVTVWDLDTGRQYQPINLTTGFRCATPGAPERINVTPAETRIQHDPLCASRVPFGECTCGFNEENCASAPSSGSGATTEYRVKWEIDVSADSPIAAARLALAMQRDPHSTATVFDVTPIYDRPAVQPATIRIDLAEQDAPCEHIPHNPDVMQTVCERCNTELFLDASTDTWKARAVWERLQNSARWW